MPSGLPADRPRPAPTLVILFLSFSVFMAGSAPAPSLTASLSRNLVPVGETVTLSLTLQNANPSAVPVLPALTNLVQIGAPRPVHSVNIVNGETSSQTIFHYQLQAMAPGEVTIPAIRAQAQGSLLTSQALSLIIVPSASSQTPSSPTQFAFLRLLLAKNEIFLGEALPIEVHVYYLAAREAHLPQLPSPGFISGKMAQGPQTSSRVGQADYHVVPFKSYVRAVKAGDLVLGPATMTLSVPRPNSRRTIFGDYAGWQTVTLQSESHQVRVLPLPAENVPPTFNGAVGIYSLAASAGPTNLNVGDPITVKATLSGRGLLESLLLPDQAHWSNAFKAYPPNSAIQATDQLGLAGSKTFEQVVIPLEPEIKTLPPLRFSYFDVEQKAYRTLNGPAFPLELRAAPPSPLPATAANASSSKEEPEFAHIKARLGEIRSSGVPLLMRPWFIALQAAPLLAWLAAVFWRRHQHAMAHNPRLRRRREAGRQMQKGLADLRRAAETGDSQTFFRTVSRLLQVRIGERLDLADSSITEAVVEERLRGAAPEDVLERLHELFRVCNHARYAPEQHDHELTALLPKVESLLADLGKIK